MPQGGFGAPRSMGLCEDRLLLTLGLSGEHLSVMILYEHLATEVIRRMLTISNFDNIDSEYVPSGVHTLFRLVARAPPVDGDPAVVFIFFIPIPNRLATYLRPSKF